MVAREHSIKLRMGFNQFKQFMRISLLLAPRCRTAIAE